jgi:hypothetical protein
MGESTTRTIQLVPSIFLNVNINTIKLIRQDWEKKITTRTDQHTVSIRKTRKTDVPRNKENEDVPYRTTNIEVHHVEYACCEGNALVASAKPTFPFTVAPSPNQ